MADGRRIVVTGALGALGGALVALAAARGWRVAGVDYAPARPGRPETLGGVDLSSPDAAAAAMAQAAERLGGGIDALACVAGGFAWETIGDGSPATWERMFRLNVGVTLASVQAALPHIAAPGGAIVLVGAGAALKAGAGLGAYGASKAGVHRLAEALAEEQKARGIRVNAVLPSIIDTPANRADMPQADHSAWVTPAELAEVMLFLLAPAASGVTGALLPVSGRV
jgi:NAD(P)-dependent dehydrogenase (short-subunit alcohol dehydrogenase family)